MLKLLLSLSFFSSLLVHYTFAYTIYDTTWSSANGGDGSYFEIHSDALTWSDAKTAAAQLTKSGYSDGHLAEIRSLELQNFIWTWIDGLITNGDLKTYDGVTWPVPTNDIVPVAEDGGFASYIWLGGSDSGTERTWQWSSNDETFYVEGNSNNSDYVNWGAGSGVTEPDNFPDGTNEDGFAGQDGLAMALQGWWNVDGSSTGAIGNAGQWNDVGTANELFYLVQFSPVPELAQTPLIIILALSIGITHARSRRRNFLQD
tara:strand:+ start:155 stop:931 length:777 start_codon:yes stop_codon:yes gene_type:complete